VIDANLSAINVTMGATSAHGNLGQASELVRNTARLIASRNSI
jgi:hypothetical protein